jgi:ubiquinone/menaquinone biosynthesis C-methylase UbiE
MMLFNSIGKSYGKTRQADERIVDRLIRFLSLKYGTSVADIGAGTGNYSIALAETGLRIKAVEPSTMMSSWAPEHPTVEWIAGYAEEIPLKNDSVEGIVSTLALPHFSDVERAIKEMARILDHGPIVIFTFDPEGGRRTWLYDYFPYFWDAFDQLPSLSEVSYMLEKATEQQTVVETFTLPPDLKDNFAAAGWRKPQLYLDKHYRANISSFRKTTPDVVEKSVNRLASDLASGRWRDKYGTILELDEMDAGYRFLFKR